jgi:glycosyltransferase involved in cell wall biosynthesis
MRILITTGIFPPDIGGPATYVPQVATALAARGHTITVMTLSGDRYPLSPVRGERDRVKGEYPFQVVRLRRQAFKPWRWFLTVFKIFRLGLRADVLFVNGLALEAVVANCLLRKPVVQKVVGDLAWERAADRGWVKDQFEDFQKKRYDTKIEALKALRGWWHCRSDRVIVPSCYLARWVQGWGVPKEKITVIYNAVEPVDSIQPSRLPLATCLKLRVVTVGRLVPLKQVDKIIEAIAECDGVGLVIVGDGPEHGPLEELVRTLDLTDRVYFAGRRSKAETLSLMAACDLFVLNSTHEGLPHVVLEAMSLGLPVVATAVGGTPEVVRNGQNGLLIDLSHADLIQTLRQLVNSDDFRKTMAKQCCALIPENFRLPLMIKRVEQLLAHAATIKLKKTEQTM